jgi:hypothetical protein
VRAQGVLGRQLRRKEEARLHSAQLRGPRCRSRRHVLLLDVCGVQEHADVTGEGLVCSPASRTVRLPG